MLRSLWVVSFRRSGCLKVYFHSDLFWFLYYIMGNCNGVSFSVFFFCLFSLRSSRRTWRHWCSAECLHHVTRTGYCQSYGLFFWWELTRSEMSYRALLFLLEKTVGNSPSEQGRLTLCLFTPLFWSLLCCALERWICLLTALLLSSR